MLSYQLSIEEFALVDFAVEVSDFALTGKCAHYPLTLVKSIVGHEVGAVAVKLTVRKVAVVENAVIPRKSAFAVRDAVCCLPLVGGVSEFECLHIVLLMCGLLQYLFNFLL